MAPDPFHPHPDFVALCDVAEKRGLQVHLGIEKPTGEIGNRQPPAVNRVAILRGKQTLAHVRTDLPGLNNAARALLTKVGAGR